MTAKYSGIIFDLDGTLYKMDRLGFHMAAGHLTSLRCLQASRKALKALSGKHFGSKERFLEEYYSSAAGLAGKSTEAIMAWEKKFYKSFISILHKHYHPRPDIERLISSLDIPCIVLSDYDRVDDRLRALNISPELFTHRYYSGEFGGLKPHPAVFEAVAEKTGRDASELLVVGDLIEKDGKGARNAGMDFFHVDDQSWPKLIKKLTGEG